MAQCDAPKGYTKMASHSTTAGEFFEVKMVALLFLRALNEEGLIFEMGSNVAGAGALDDIVLRFKRNNNDAWTTLFVQLKHKLNANLTNDKLCSKNKDFGICKYFESFLKIKYTPDPLERLFDGEVCNIHCAIFTNAKKSPMQLGPKTAYQEALECIRKEYDCTENEETPLRENTSSCEGVAKGTTNIDNDTICAHIDAAFSISLEMCRNLLGSEKGGVYQFGDVEEQSMKNKKRVDHKVCIKSRNNNMPGLCEEDLGGDMMCLFRVDEEQSMKEINVPEQAEDSTKNVDNNEAALKEMPELSDGDQEGPMKPDVEEHTPEGNGFTEQRDDNKNRMDLDPSKNTFTDNGPSEEQLLYSLKIQFQENQLNGDELTDFKDRSEILCVAVSSESSSRLSVSKLLQVLEDGCVFCDIKTLSNTVFQETFLAEWKNGTRKTIVVACNETEKEKEKHGLDDEELQKQMETFLNNLLVFHSQPSVTQLDAVIKKELKIRLKKEQKYGVNFDSVFAAYMNKMEHLCEGTTVLDNKHGVVLEAWHKTVADNCSSGDELLYRLKIQFQEIELNTDKLKDLKNISAVLCVAVSSESSSRLSVTKLLQVLEDGYLFFGIKTLSDSTFQESILAEWKNGSRKTIVVACNETETATKGENLTNIKKLRDQLDSEKRIIVLTSKHDAAYFGTDVLGENAACLEDKFEYSTMTNESKDMIFDAKFYLQNHETRVKNLFGCDQDKALKYLTASAVVEILEGVQSHCTVAFPSQEIYIDRWLERAEIVKASILCEKSLSACVLVLDSTLDTVQSIISQADKSLTAQEIEESLHKLHPPDETQCESETFTLGMFKCKFVLNSSGKYLSLRTSSTEQPDSRCFNFVFEGFDQDNLSSLLGDSASQHILRFDDGKMKWVESRAVEVEMELDLRHEAPALMNIIRQHLDDEIVQSLATKTVADIDDRLVVICAEPGMGKSTLIGHLLSKMKHIYPGYWVIAIPLNYNTHLLDDNSLIGDAHAFLSAAAGIKSEFQRQVLKVALQEMGTVAVILDGFDEVSPLYTKVCCNLLTKLCETKVWKIWVTTRYSTRDVLEDHTATLSRKLRPFDDKDKRKFFELFLNNKKIDEKTKKDFLDLIITKKNTAFTDREQEIMGIPLQTRMMAEVFVDLLADGQDVSEKLKEMDLLYLLEEFVKKKREIFVNEKQKVLVSDAKNRPAVLECEYDSQHKHFAVHEIFSEEDIRAFGVESSFNAETSKLYELIKSGDDKTGIIDGIVNGKPKFIHRVFIEYFVARFITENIGKNIKLLEKYLYTSNFFVVRELLDKILAKGNKLHVAVLNEDASEVQRLVKEGADVCDAAGRTAMHLAAAKCNNINRKGGIILDFFVAQCNDINLADNLLKYTPLQYADITRAWRAIDRLLLCPTITTPDTLPEVQNELEKMNESELIPYVVRFDLDGLLQFCLNKPALKNLSLKAFSGKLREASDCKSLKVATILAKNVSSIEAKEDVTKEVFYIALARKHANLAVVLISRGVDIKSPSAIFNGARPLMFAVRSDQEDVVAALLANVPESEWYDFVNLVDDSGCTPMYRAAESGNLEIVELLFNAGSNISFKNRDTALMIAAENGHLEVIEFLLGKVTDPGCKRSYLNRRDEDGRTAFERAKSDGVKDMLRNHGADSKTKQSITANHHAASREKTTNPIPQNQDAENRTPLHIAAQANDLGSAKKEIEDKNAAELRAHVNTSDSYGNTALHLAASFGLVEMIHLFHEAGGDLALVNSSKKTLLMLAVESGDRKCVQWLCQKVNASGVVNKMNNDGNTALHLAATIGDYVMVKNLIKAGADWRLRNVMGETPLICAAIGGYLDVVKRIVFCVEEDDMAGRRRGGRSAYIRVKDLALKNAIDHARENNHDDVREFLEDEGPFLKDKEGVEYS